MGIMLLTVAVTYAFSKLSPKLMIKSLKPLLPIILLTSVLQLYYNNTGDVLWSYKKIAITDGGIYTAIFIAIRIVALLVISSLLTYTTSPTDLTDAIERLLSPLKIFKVDIHTFAMMMTIALRFIPTLFNETQKILKAQSSRGVDFKEGTLKQQIGQIISLLIPMLVISFKRAADLADAMEARGYIPGATRTKLNIMKSKLSNLIIS